MLCVCAEWVEGFLAEVVLPVVPNAGSAAIATNSTNAGIARIGCTQIPLWKDSFDHVVYRKFSESNRIAARRKEAGRESPVNCWREWAPMQGFASAPSQTLLQCSAYQVDAIVGVSRVYQLKDHIVACIEFGRNGIELFPGGRRLLVDANDNQPRLQPLQIGKRP